MWTDAPLLQPRPGPISHPNSTPIPSTVFIFVDEEFKKKKGGDDEGGEEGDDRDCKSPKLKIKKNQMHGGMHIAIMISYKKCFFLYRKSN